MKDDFNGYQWWQEEIMLEWENQMIILINIDNKMVITWISFPDEVKCFL